MFFGTQLRSGAAICCVWYATFIREDFSDTPPAVTRLVCFAGVDDMHVSLGIAESREGIADLRRFLLIVNTISAYLASAFTSRCRFFR